MKVRCTKQKVRKPRASPWDAHGLKTFSCPNDVAKQQPFPRAGSVLTASIGVMDIDDQQ